MFNSIRAKIISLVVSLLVGLIFVLSISTLVSFKQGHRLLIESCDFTISTYAEKINKEIIKLQNNAVDLALLGEVYYKSGKSESLANFMVKNIFERYKQSLGGGIWFEPFVINPNKRLICTYAYRNDDGKVLIDKNFASENYNYLNQNWYVEIKPRLKKSCDFGWSKPYYENQGSETLMTTVGAGIFDNGKFIGMSTVDWEISDIAKTVTEMKPTKNSFALFADKINDYIIVSTDDNIETDTLGSSLKELPWYSEHLQNGKPFKYAGKNFISYIKTLDNNMIYVLNVPEDELMGFAITQLFVVAFALLFVSLGIAYVVYTTLNKNVSTPIETLMQSVKEFGKGNFDAKAEIESPQEFTELAGAFNTMSSDIKNYVDNISKVTAEKEKMKSELSIARTIQYTALPSTFYPEAKEFNIFATMETAKEVGGDFYDFFYINNSQLMFLIADVSGKGIPAALFAMTTKMLIKNMVNEGYQSSELMSKVNNLLCDNNKQGYFVTLLSGTINLNTGTITFVNCGHNPPLIKRVNGEYEYLKLEPNIALGVMPNMSFKTSEIQINPGDRIFLYTDGITEALNIKEELFGEEKLKACLNTNTSRSVEQTLSYVNADIKEFRGKAEQSDDITMLEFEYMGTQGKSLVNHYSTMDGMEGYEKFIHWLMKMCKDYKISQSIMYKVELVAEEIYTNIANYAYDKHNDQFNRPIEVEFEKAEKYITLKFIDHGIQYNPLEKDDPDITLSAEERPIGGLGIYVVKNSVNDISYEYTDSKNILTLVINL